MSKRVLKLAAAGLAVAAMTSTALADVNVEAVHTFDNSLGCGVYSTLLNHSGSNSSFYCVPAGGGKYTLYEVWVYEVVEVRG